MLREETTVKRIAGPLSGCKVVSPGVQSYTRRTCVCVGVCVCVCVCVCCMEFADRTSDGEYKENKLDLRDVVRCNSKRENTQTNNESQSAFGLLAG